MNVEPVFGYFVLCGRRFGWAWCLT